MLTEDKESIIHSSAAEFAVAHYKNPIRPKGSAVLIAAENLAELHFKTEDDQKSAINVFQEKVERILSILRNERRGAARQ